MSSCVVEVPDSVTIRSIAGFADTLRQAIDANSVVTLDVAALRELDLSFVQLVHAARVHAGDAAALRLAAPAGDAVAALLRRAGFLTQPDPADLDFWFHGETPQ